MFDEKRCLEEFKKVIGIKDAEDILSSLEKNGFYLKQINPKIDFNHEYDLIFLNDNMDSIKIYYVRQNEKEYNIILTICLSFYQNFEHIWIRDINRLKKILNKIFKCINDYNEGLLTGEKIWKDVTYLLKNEKEQLDHILIYLKLNNFYFSNDNCIQWFDGIYSFSLKDNNRRLVNINFHFNEDDTLNKIALYILVNGEEVYFNNLREVKRLQENIIKYI